MWEPVDPGWLAGHLHDADMRVIEVEVRPAAYGDWNTNAGSPPTFRNLDVG
jgi:hypothetical protein